MKCQHCGKEQSEEREFEGLICRPIEQFNVPFNKIIIPKGWDIPTLSEGQLLLNDKQFVEWSKFKDGNHDFWIKQPFKHNKDKSAWLGCSINYFYLLAYSNLNSNFAVRGVLLIRRRK